MRRHLPRTISRFNSQRAADILVNVLRNEPLGLIRYKALRGLGRLATETRVDLDRPFLQELLSSNLIEHLRMQVTHFVIASEREQFADQDSTQLLLDLVSDKASQARQRAFRVLQLLNPDDDIRGVHHAICSGDKTAHANGLEYLATIALEFAADTRELLRLATDNLERGAQAELARSQIPGLPQSAMEALARLEVDDDEALRTLTAHHLGSGAARAGAGLPGRPVVTPGIQTEERNSAD
jgi:hypothetical protein